MNQNESNHAPASELTSCKAEGHGLKRCWHADCSLCPPEREHAGDLPMHNFEYYDDRFSCPNCQEALPKSEFPQTCEECGFVVEVFLTRDDAVDAMLEFEEDSDSITTRPCHVYGLGWIVGHTRLLLV